MEGGERWRVMRCGGGEREDKVILNHIMMKFRPIAPKPVAGGSEGSVQAVQQPPRAKNISVGSRGRTKRKYVRVRKNNISKEENNKPVVTLQLLPEIEKSSGGDDTDGGSSCSELDPSSSNLGNVNYNQWLSLSEIGRDVDSTTAHAAVNGRVESWVTVESVRGTCMKAGAAAHQGFGMMMMMISTDEEKLRSLEADTCPGFVSDGWNRVQWVNGAFRRMVAEQQSPDAAVWLSMSEELPYTYSAFTCQVKLKYMVGNYNNIKDCYYSQMVPCDMLRMDAGGFAWRLDVKAALTLAVDAAPLRI